jgi:ATP-dependent DNA helicase RecQ
MQLQEALSHYWSLSELRKQQQLAVDTVLAGSDCLVLLPTGGGKSLCYQLPALLMDGVTIVVSPLISLIEDQVKDLSGRGIQVLAIHSAMHPNEILINLNNAVNGWPKLFYCSPERLQQPLVQAKLQQMKVAMLVVDEAHCISEWGNEFRPNYRKLLEVRKLLPKVPCMALTATATPKVQTDIRVQLSINGPTIAASFKRKNLSYNFREEPDPFTRTKLSLQKVAGSAIIYCRNRRKTAEISEWLQREGIAALPYHAGLTNQVRANNQKQWMQNKVRVLVATNAFGMGINKPDVRLVIHWELPESVEAYFQESGRVGRDGKPAFALLYHTENAWVESYQKVQAKYPELAFCRRIYQSLANYFHLAVGAGLMQSYDLDLAQFCKTYNYQLKEVLPALQTLADCEFITVTESVFRPAKVMFLLNPQDLYAFEVAHYEYVPIIKTILKVTGANAFSWFSNITTIVLARTLNMEQVQFEKQLEELMQYGVVTYQPASSNPRLTFLTERWDSERLPIPTARLNTLKENHLARLNQLRAIASNKLSCRQNLLLDYFGEESNEPCGICDLCRKPEKSQLSLISAMEAELFEILNQGEAFSAYQLVQLTKSTPETIAIALHQLLKQGKVAPIEGGYKAI